MLRVNQGFFGRDQPIGEDLARIPVRRQLDLGSVREDGRQRLARRSARGCARRVGRAVGGRLRSRRSRPARARCCPARLLALERIPEDVLLLPLAGGLVADLREEDRHARQPVLRPGLGPRSHERQGHGAGDAFRRPVLDGAVEVDRADAEIAAAGGEHLPDELVVRLVLGDRRPDPAVIGLRRIGPEIDGELGLDPQDVAPLHRPVIGELIPLQQAIDQEPALVLRVRILE